MENKIEDIKLGDRVKVIGKNTNGTVAFLGETHFSDGTWLGIVLDESKGRNNGSVDGTRYFKCPRNYGVFVRPCQITKENVDCADANEKQGNIAPSKTANYPNYLKCNSKLKSEKRTYASKSTDIGKTKSKYTVSLNHAASQVASQNAKETIPAGPTANKENEIFKGILRTASETLPKIPKSEENSAPDWHAIKEENEILKSKLKSAEESSQETLLKYKEATEEINGLKDELDFKKKQIRIQKLNLKLLKMRQCNHYKKIGSYKDATKNYKTMSTSDSQTMSDDEFDLESMKTLASVQRITELEEQNRIMIQGLFELREFLKINSNPQSLGVDASIAKARRPAKNETGDLTSLSESQLKEYSEMLREMRKFGEIMKENSKLKNLEVQNLPNRDPSLSYERSQKEQMSGDNLNTFRLTHQLQNSQTAPENLQNSAFSNTKEFQNYLQTYDGQNSNHTFKLTKNNSLVRYVQNKVTSIPERDPVQELRELVSTVLPNPGLESLDTPLLQEDLRIDIRNFVPNSTSGKPRFDSAEPPLAFNSHSMDVGVNPCGDSVPVRKKSQTRMFPSGRMYQRKEMGDNV